MEDSSLLAYFVSSSTYIFKVYTIIMGSLKNYIEAHDIQ